MLEGSFTGLSDVEPHDMVPEISFQPITVRSVDSEGRLVLIDGQLTAVLVRLQHEIHAERRGTWFLEIGFGDLTEQHPLFANLEDAAAWVRRHLSNEAPAREGSFDTDAV
jgi:hypothetical protein